MANNIVLDTKKHRNTRIITKRGAEFGENMHCVPVIADELRHLVLEYPVCLIKDNNTGKFGLYALHGLEPGENLFLHGDEWNATYIPLHIKRQPFTVGVTGKDGDKPTPENTVLTIDMDNTRVQESEGEALFDDKGNATEYLKGVSNLLQGLIPGIIKTDAFIDTLAEHDLIESVQLTVSFADGEEKKFDGLYTINEDNLQELSGELVQEFHQKGYLQACNLLLASIGNVQKLINLKKKK